MTHNETMSREQSDTAKIRIAIVGMGCIFPGSPDLKAFWHLLYQGKDAIEDIPETTHWRIGDYFDPDPGKADHTYCRRGGFLPPVTFDPMRYGIPPNNLEATDTSQLLGLEVARMALEDAGYPPGHPMLQEKKVNVILGVTGTQELVIPLGARLGHPIWKKALEDAGIGDDKKKEVISRISDAYVQWQENSFPGLLGNVVAGRIANRMNLSGTNSVTDAACASALSAVHTAVMELAAGKCDVSITGGVDTLNDIFMHMCFSKTGVLSHSSDARPFSRQADGTVLGEGIGMLVLKRLEDAEKDGDTIYAVIRGVGTSSDGRTSAVYAPDAGGQLKALKEAYREAGIHPSTVELVEAHGTGTRVGDKVEFEALNQCFGPVAPRHFIALGSVKSMIGHTKAAAGAAGMIKAALALYHKAILPTLKAEEPDPELKIDQSCFYLNAESKPWIPETGHPRRSGVSAFGFGGSNFHVVLEEYRPAKEHVSWDGSIDIMAFSSDTRKDLVHAVQKIRTRLNQSADAFSLKRESALLARASRSAFSSAGPFRLLMIHRTDRDIFPLLDKALECVETGTSQTDIFFSDQADNGKLAFLFPGQGSQYPGMGKDLITLFPEGLAALEEAALVFAAETEGFPDIRPLQEYIFPPPVHVREKTRSEALLRDTHVAQPAIGALSCAMVRILKRFNIAPDVTCGHSFGELPALYAAGWMNEPTLFRLSAARGRYMAEAAGSGDTDPGGMLAVQAPLETITHLIAEEGLDLILANRNSPDQGVLSGPTREILRARQICRLKKIKAVKLPVAAAFHSRMVETAAAPFHARLRDPDLTPTPIEVYSNTTGRPYDRNLSAVKDLLGHQLIHSVDFVGSIENMAREGVKTFIELGPRTVLSDLTRKILPSGAFTALSLDASCGKASGLEDLARVLCSLAAKGYNVNLTHWEDPIPPHTPQRMKVRLTGANPRPSKKDTPPPSPPEPAEPANTQDANPDRRVPPVSKGPSMTLDRHFEQRQKTDRPAFEAMKMVQKGLEALQQLQAQTARAHEKFLETQTQAGRTLAAMLEKTRLLAFDESPESEPVSIPRELDSSKPLPVVQPDSPKILQPKPQPEIVPEARPEPQSVHRPAFPPAPVVSPEVPADTGPDNRSLLFDIVGRLTGFPVEMLEPSMNIESDLGIDSIKKVEIVSELEKQFPGTEAVSTDRIGTVQTLQDILDAMCPVSEPVSANNCLPEAEAVSSASVSHQPVAHVLMATISELTGFPSEMLEPSMNLESDLGIDSIKRVEIFSRLEQELDGAMKISTDDLAGLKTIGEILDKLSKSPDTKTSSGQPQPTVAMKEGADSDRKIFQQDIPTRRVVTLKSYPTHQIRFYNGARIQLPGRKKIYLTRDKKDLGQLFQAEFQRTGMAAELIDIETVPDLTDAAGLVIIPDDLGNSAHETAVEFLKSTFELIRKNGPHLMDAGREKGAFLAVISFFGGGFGFDGRSFDCNPVYGGLAGLVKTVRLEWKNVLCRVLDLPVDIEKIRKTAEAAASLMMTQGSVEMGLDEDCCNIPTLEEQAIHDIHPVNLGPDDVVVITGGARGVTAACAVELARQYAPTLVLVGRTPIEAPEPEWAENLQDPSDLKKAILVHHFKGQTPRPLDLDDKYRQIIAVRDIQRHIRQMETFGAKVRYMPADVRSPEDMDRVIRSVRDTFGPVSALIHGAGVIHDKPILDKTVKDFARVLETKVNGLSALLSALKQDRLKFLILFSSVAARTGNPGQCDYAAANEVLNKTAHRLAADRPGCKVLAMNWGPWEGGMVNESLKREFMKKGLALIPLKQGAAHLLKEMGNPMADGPEIIVGAHLQEPRKTRGPVPKAALSMALDKDSAPILQAHEINGEPVVPLAMIMECLALAAEKNNPGLVFAGMDDMRLLKGIKPGQGSVKMHVLLEKCRPEGDRYAVVGHVTSDDDRGGHVHAGCRIILKDRLPKAPVLSRSADMDLRPCSLCPDRAYSDVLFHKGFMQCITSINGCSEKGIEVTAAVSGTPDEWVRDFPASRWTLSPLMLDAAFQAAILWSHEIMGQVCLPSFIAGFRLYSPFKTLAGPVRILFTVNERTRNRITGYFTFLDENEAVVAGVMGFEAVTDPSLSDKFKPKPLFSRDRILAFAQGNPSEAFGKQYAVFDNEREIARLPRPPYFFMDRVMRVDHPQWEMVPGGWIETQYDIPPDAWYFRANRTGTMPFCILLEVALQPCGWLAAYAGSALHSLERLHFRNLGGKAILYRTPTGKDGTVTVRCRMTDVSQAGGMIIQTFDMAVMTQTAKIYEGNTRFGFFTGQALSNQIGIRNSRFAPDGSAGTPDPFQFTFQNDAPLTPNDRETGHLSGMPSKALRMIDGIELLSMDQGTHGQGYVRAVKIIDPAEWFFHAHFYQDPVCPGSLGIESFLQMIRFFLIQKYDMDPSRFSPCLMTGRPHEWMYRGQITPGHSMVRVQAHIKEHASDKEGYSASADGALWADGRCIYEMTDFGVVFSKNRKKVTRRLNVLP